MTQYARKVTIPFSEQGTAASVADLPNLYEAFSLRNLHYKIYIYGTYRSSTAPGFENYIQPRRSNHFNNEKEPCLPIFGSVVCRRVENGKHLKRLL